MSSEILQTAMSAVQSTMKKAIALAPDSWMPGGTPDPLIEHKHGLVGTQVSRVDGPLKVKGAARFAAEYALPGLTYAATMHSTIARGRIVNVDTTAAEAAPGVVLVMTHLNAPRIKPMPVFGTSAKAVGPDDAHVLQDERIHWNGQPVAVVLADSQEQADHAKSLIRIDYAEEDPVTRLAEAEARRKDPASFQGEPLHLEVGDAEQALADAPFKVDDVFRTPRHNHNPIELHAVTLRWEEDGSLTIHDAQQAVVQSAWTIAQVFELKEEQVRITSPFVGGGFGSKVLWHHQVLAAAAAKLAGRPVRMALTREGVYRTIGGRTATEQRMAIGADAAGHFKAIVHTGITPKAAHNLMPEPFTVGTRCSYAAETFLIDQKTTDMNMVANTFMRAPGEAVGTFALESAIDELAEKLGMDPIELRILNEPEKDPTTGLPFSSRHIVEAWRAGAERFGWSQRSATPGQRREGEWLVGVGCATATYPYYRMPGGAARIILRAAGVRVEIPAHEMGMGTSTTHGIVVADRLGLALEQVDIAYGDSAFPGTFLAGGSSQTASIGAAVIAAHEKLVAELLKLAGNDSPLAGLKPAEVGARDGGLCALDDPARCESYASILGRAQRDDLTVEAQASNPIETEHWSMHSFGAVFCEMRVNAVTGETRVARLLGSYDCGRILNAKTAMSQFRGGIIMGLGLALTEETFFDERTGRIMNPSLAEYHLPVHADVPEIDVIWTDIPDPRAPMGARGIGEIGITGVGAAVANAIYNATGKRIRDLPITLDKLL